MNKGEKKKISIHGDNPKNEKSEESALEGKPSEVEKEGKENEIEELKKRLEEKEKEAKENYDRFLRMAAELENYKKRAAKEKEEYIKYAHEDLIRAILPFVDNLERAVNHAEKVVDSGVLVEGVRLTLQELLSTLNKFGLSSFNSVGQPFDPTRHEAMLVVETDQHEPDHVVEEFQKGYFLHDRLIRPAMVSVSKPLQKETQALES